MYKRCTLQPRAQPCRQQCLAASSDSLLHPQPFCRHKDHVRCAMGAREGCLFWGVGVFSGDRVPAWWIMQRHLHTTDCTHSNLQMESYTVALHPQESEVTRLAGIEAAADRLRGQLAAADASLSERDSTIQLLNADKAYLSKEAQVGRTPDSVLAMSDGHEC